MCGGVGCRGRCVWRGIRHNIFGACETERRPRGASRAKPAHLFRASPSCEGTAVRLVPLVLKIASLHLINYQQYHLAFLPVAHND